MVPFRGPFESFRISPAANVKPGARVVGPMAREHHVELRIEWVDPETRDDEHTSMRPEFRCARCGGDVDYGTRGWTHAERMVAAPA